MSGINGFNINSNVDKTGDTYFSIDFELARSGSLTKAYFQKDTVFQKRLQHFLQALVATNVSQILQEKLDDDIPYLLNLLHDEYGKHLWKFVCKY